MSSPVKTPYRALFLITTPKLAGKASELFTSECMPLHFRLNALGTAPNDIMDLLGLGDIDKSLLLSFLPKTAADALLKQIRSALKIGTTNSGIGFTIPLSGANRLLLQITENLVEEQNTSIKKEETPMDESKYVLIAASVNQGYTEEVMNAARSAGAGGGTVLHSRQIAEESTVTTFGLGVQEEKEIVLIVALREKKVDIMQAITTACGSQTEAKGNVVSLPLDTVIGLNED